MSEPRIRPTTHARKGSGDIGADSILGSASSAIVIICINLYWRTCGRVMVRRIKKTLNPFPLEGGVWAWERDYEYTRNRKRCIYIYR